MESIFFKQKNWSADRATYDGDLAGLFASSNAQLVDSRFSDVRSLLGVVQLVLDLPVTQRAAAHLLLLVDKPRQGRCD